MSDTIARQRTSATTGLQTEFDFELPIGYVDGRGRPRRRGLMRLATARDEIAPQADARVRANPAYLTVVLLARTVTHLDGVEDVDTEVIEELFAADLAFLQDLYRRINQGGHAGRDARCPECGHEFVFDPRSEAVGE